MDDYSKTVRECDIVMKGGVTSGIVYPGAVCELARTFRFRSIGGTSAGAIAAAATAAAEYARQNGTPAAFDALKKLPSELAEGGKLFSLFAPQPATRPLFRTLTAALGGGWTAPFRVLFAALWNFPLAALAGIALVAAYVAFLVRWDHPLLSLISLLVPIFFAFVLLAGAVAWRFVREVPKNHYGLCRGQGALTDWLADQIDRLAGKTGGPLTFGDLWGKDIDLQMMTTCLSQGRPYRIPFQGAEEKLFLFDPKDLGDLFPPRIVEWMIRHARKSSVGRYGNLLPMPLARDLPVVVATRMSLSFPVLLSAVRLYGVDFGSARDGAPRTPEPCWFSDGGISSNFPVHFFDSLLPTRPTFAINLRYGEKDDPAPAVFLPSRNSDGLAETWDRFDRGSGLSRLLGFFSAIFDSMRNWTDNTQLRLPGYRDRVVAVYLGPSEGGLNLDMPSPRIATLTDRGRMAGERLANHFAPGATVEMSWDNHRWIRYRSTMATLAEELKKAGRALDRQVAGEISYPNLIIRPDTDPPSSYRWKRGAQQQLAEDATLELRKLAGILAASDQRLDEGAPHPIPELRARPRI